MPQQPEIVIGFVLKGYPRLSETFILNEIYLLEQLGLKLHIFAMRDPNESKVHERVGQIRAGVTYIPDDFRRGFWAVLGANIRQWRRQPERYREALRFALADSLRRRDSATLKRFTQGAYLVERGLPGSGVGYFHVHFAHDPATMTYFASRLSGIPFSISAHAKDIYLQDRALLRRKLAAAAFTVTCTGFNRRYLQDLAGEGAAVLRSYHGIDLNFYALPERKELPAVPEILSIGRLVPKKGFPALVEALGLLRERGYDFRCRIIGSGPLKEALRQQIDARSLAGQVELLAEMSQAELRRCYQRAGIFALACEVQEDGDRDGIPNVIVEAMAMGLAVVSTRISGIPECVAHGRSGLLVEERDTEAFANALAELLDDPEKMRACGRAGREIVEADFDAHRNIARIAALLQAALNRQPIQTSNLEEVRDDSNRYPGGGDQPGRTGAGPVTDERNHHPDHAGTFWR